MTRVLVTGASGFIGRHLTSDLRASGYDIIEADSRSGDVADRETWSRFPAAKYVVHLAGRPFVPQSWLEPAEFIRCNVLGTVQALEYARSRNARLVFLSSYIYGVPKALPIAELAPSADTNPYALSKRLAEEACQFYADRFGVEVVILRPFNVYGPGQADMFLIPLIARQVREANAIRVKDLAPRRDYVYVADVASAIVKAMCGRDKFGVFNVGSGVSHSVRDIIDVIQNVAGTTLPVHSDEERRRDEIMDSVADISMAKQRLGWTPKWGLRDGIEATLRVTYPSSSVSGNA